MGTYRFAFPCRSLQHSVGRPCGFHAHSFWFTSVHVVSTPASTFVCTDFPTSDFPLTLDPSAGSSTEVKGYQLPVQGRESHSPDGPQQNLHVLNSISLSDSQASSACRIIHTPMGPPPLPINADQVHTHVSSHASELQFTSATSLTSDSLSFSSDPRTARYQRIHGIKRARTSYGSPHGRPPDTT